MYRYDKIDQTLVAERVAQYREQLSRRLTDEMSEEEFRPLRLQNGLYMQRHAYMLRVAIPYGLLSSQQLRALADIAEKYDRGWGHFTTRQNIQYNWIRLEDTPDILADLAKVEMHAIQTSGNCVRNITTDPFVGVSADERVDTRPYCEWLRQWSTFHPEFAYLPRKFKVAINGASEDRTALQVHDIGIALHRSSSGEVLADMWVGGGMGRTPIIGTCIRHDLPGRSLCDYVQAILRVYNRHGRRDNLFKARIKILLKALGEEAFTRQVDEEFALIEKINPLAASFSEQEWQRINQHFADPPYQILANLTPADFDAMAGENAQAFAQWRNHNTRAHRMAGYVSVIASLKPHRHLPPGDMTATQMRLIADLADRASFGEIRITHEQNVVLADVPQSALYSLWQSLKEAHLATPNIGLLTDIIACPGGDYCALANARSIPIAQAIQAQFDDLDYLFDLGTISINISGCINSCGHHHIGNIGILGVDKDNQEFYQITLGGEQGNQTRIGKVIGPAFGASEVPEVIRKIIAVYTQHREQSHEGYERFSDTLERIGISPFKEAVYG